MTVYCPPTDRSSLSHDQLQGVKFRRRRRIIPCLLVFYPIPQSLEANWRRGHYTLTRVDTGSGVWCLQFDDNKIVTGHKDGTMKVGSYNDVHVWSR